MAINMGFWVCMCSIGPGKGHGMMRKKINFFCQKNPKFIFYTMSFAHWIYWVLKIPPKPVTRQKSPFQIIVYLEEILYLCLLVNVLETGTIPKSRVLMKQIGKYWMGKIQQQPWPKNREEQQWPDFFLEWFQILIIIKSTSMFCFGTISM